MLEPELTSVHVTPTIIEKGKEWAITILISKIWTIRKG